MKVMGRPYLRREREVNAGFQVAACAHSSRGPVVRISTSMAAARSGPDELLAAVRREGIRDARLLAAIGEVPRGDFVPPELVHRAHLDTPLPIGHEQVTTQPSLVARMVEALGLTGDERVLEVGTGFGWQTALLARLAAWVWSVERWPDLAAAARARLRRGCAANVEVMVGDGTEGLAEHGPYDAIIVSATFTSVPEPLTEQLADGGRLVQPLGPGGAEEVFLFRKARSALQRERMLTRAHFVPLRGRHGFPE
jgi:protein-L-isoaspartate(D-aspartate) O-methyltransferase